MAPCTRFPLVAMPPFGVSTPRQNGSISSGTPAWAPRITCPAWTWIPPADTSITCPVRTVEAMDFDTLVPGHGPLGNKADIAEHREYLQALYDQVLAAARQGQSLEDMKKSITLDRFGHLGQYAQWRELNIDGMYRQVQLHRRGN